MVLVVVEAISEEDPTGVAVLVAARAIILALSMLTQMAKIRVMDMQSSLRLQRPLYYPRSNHR
jgi:hypothetical protein